jgi:hypothetical protein
MHPLRKLLTCWLLATYAGISLLGEGLHSLTPHGHHHGLYVVTCAEHHHDHEADCCEHHRHEAHGADADHEHESHESAEQIVCAGSSATDCHSCEICEFLFQAVSEAPQIAATPDLHVLVADLPWTAHGLYSAIILGLHAARGPPHLAA